MFKRNIAFTLSAILLSSTMALADASPGPRVTGATKKANDSIDFKMVTSAGGQACISDADVDVTIRSFGPFETMDIFGKGLPPNTGFDVFVIQVPKAPFGLSWYQGDLESNKHGIAHAHFVGRFSDETFILAPGVAPAPSEFSDDAKSNPATPPVQTYHLGIWFNDPNDAANLGCAGTVTPFNGEHHAGIQAFNTSNFPDTEGPLLELEPSGPPPTQASMVP
jgi:hypothetical protein